MGVIIEKDKKYVANTYARFPVELSYGKGSLVYDTDGKEYIDLGSGIAVSSFGIADEEWASAVNAQLTRLQHTSNLYYTEPCANLAQIICERTGMKKVFFSNSGAEANECAIKAARKYAAEKKGEDYYTIITLENSFHGRTITTLSATGQEHYHKDFKPLTPGFIHTPANDIEALIENVKGNKVAAIMIECVQGEGGVNPLSYEYINSVYEICQKEDIIFIVDEVQTGNGRCGSLYAYMNYNVVPDIVSTAKGLGGGLPIGAAIFGEKVENVLGYGDHGSTFGGNPVCCAGAISIINRLTDDFLSDVKKKSEYIISSLENSKGIKSVTGSGLMLGIETEVPASDIVKKCIEKGVLCLTAKNKVRLLPALNIPIELLSKAVNIIKEVCAETIE